MAICQSPISEVRKEEPRFQHELTCPMMSGYGLSEGDIRQLSKRSSASSINSILSEEYYSDEHTQLTPTKENLMLKDELTPENIPQEADSSPNKHLLSNYLDNLQKLSHIHKVRERLVR